MACKDVTMNQLPKCRSFWIANPTGHTNNLSGKFPLYGYNATGRPISWQIHHRPLKLTWELVLFVYKDISDSLFWIDHNSFLCTKQCETHDVSILAGPFCVCLMWMIRADSVENPKQGYSPWARRQTSTAKIKQNIRCTHEVCKQTYSWGPVHLCHRVLDLWNSSVKVQKPYLVLVYWNLEKET